MSTYTARRDLIADARERFVRDAAKHEMRVLRDDGLYRHLRFAEPGTSMYYFDLVTWPGYLAIVGDCGDYVFARIADMFEFFSTQGGRPGLPISRWGINPQYWSQKLQAPRPDAAMRYSYDVFRAHVLEWFASVSFEMEPGETSSLRAALHEQLLADHLDAVRSEHDAHEMLAAFEHDGIRIGESWEWDLREYDYAFLWCCWAIVRGIDQYRSTPAAVERGRLWSRLRLTRREQLA